MKNISISGEITCDLLKELFLGIRFSAFEKLILYLPRLEAPGGGCGLQRWPTARVASHLTCLSLMMTMVARCQDLDQKL